MRRSVTLFAVWMLAIGCASKGTSKFVTSLEPEERILVSKLNAYYYNGFQKEEGYLWLTTKKLIFVNLSRENQIAVYPLSMTSSFRHEDSRMVGRIFSFIYQERIIAFSTYSNESLYKALDQVVEFEE